MTWIEQSFADVDEDFARLERIHLYQVGSTYYDELEKICVPGDNLWKNSRQARIKYFFESGIDAYYSPFRGEVQWTPIQTHSDRLGDVAVGADVN